MLRQKDNHFIMTGKSKDPAKTSWYDADCYHRGVPFIHVENDRKIANIHWELRWLGISGSEVMTHKLTPLGVQLQQLFDRCKTPRSEGAYGGDCGYFRKIPRDIAPKVAEELWRIFTIAALERQASL